ncbi:MAG: hypothetical protein M1822_007779 [Bathelium mastoideum]|nr:MAG: hypothetical protein M1822_007779 [Bathelium mastoideum]
MASELRLSDEKSIAQSVARENSESTEVASAQKTRNGIALVPQPSDDPKDPLSWSQSKKYTILVIYCLAGFAGTASSLANQLGFEAQGKVYGKTLVQMSYTVSSAVAGIAYGPLFFVPLAQKIGRSSVIFWSLLGAMACGIWAACQTGTDDYISFTISRLFGGMFGSVPSILGSGMIVDIFYLHERGKAFTTFSLCFLLGTVAGPTFGGFIVQHVPWPNEFWWTVGLQAAVALLVLVFMEETGFTRDEKRVFPKVPESFLANRVATFLPGHKVVPRISAGELASFAIAPFKIGIMPVVLLAGTFNFISFGWFVMINTLLTVFLQEPPKAGGFGFTPQRNAAFTFALWFGIIAAQIWGYFLNDRIPLMISKRRGGIWKPEYRLHSLWIPALFLLPIGLGIFGSALQYHLHYMVLALGSFIITFACMLTIPVAVNYVVECFRLHAPEVGAIMGAYRLTLGLVIPFFIDEWIAAVGGPAWVFGMAAFFSIFSFMLVLLLMWKGHELRQFTLRSLAHDEEGKIIETSSSKGSI